MGAGMTEKDGKASSLHDFNRNDVVTMETIHRETAPHLPKGNPCWQKAAFGRHHQLVRVIAFVMNPYSAPKRRDAVTTARSASDTTSI